MRHIYQKHFLSIWWFLRSKDFEAMKARKSAIRPWLTCQYNENMLVDLPSSVGEHNFIDVQGCCKQLSFQ